MPAESQFFEEDEKLLQQAKNTAIKLVSIRKHFEQNDPDVLQHLLETVLSKIIEETAISRELEDVMDIRALSDWDAALAKDPTIQLADRGSISKRIPDAYAACNKNGRILIPSNPTDSDPFHVLGCLADIGVPVSFLALFHEKIHQLQFKSEPTREYRKIAGGAVVAAGVTDLIVNFKAESLGLDSENLQVINIAVLAMVVALLYKFFYKNRYRAFNQIMLMETQANMANRSFYDKAEGPLGETVQRHVQAHHPTTAKLAAMSDWGKDWFIKTVDRIREQILQLRALGASHKEIAALVYKGEGGDVSYGSSVLQCEIFRRQTQLSIDDALLKDRVEQIEKDQEDLVRKIPEITKRIIDGVYAQLPASSKLLDSRKETPRNAHGGGPSREVREKAREARRKTKSHRKR